MVVERQAVLGRQFAGVVPMRDDPETGHAGPAFDEFPAVVEQGRIAVEIVDEKGANERCIGGVEDHECPDQRCDDAATMDVADEDDRNIGGARESHIGEIAVPQVDLGRGARAFDHHEIGSGGQPLKAFEHCRAEAVAIGEIVAGREGRRAATLHDDLGAAIRLRLEQDRIHVGHRLDPGGASLHGLGAADLAAIAGDGRIVRHVLRLERGDLQPLIGQGPAEAGNDERLPDIGARSLQH
jgi:hypothetical protein